MTDLPPMDSSSLGDSLPLRPLPERVVISPNVLFQEIEGEAVLMDTANESYFSLDPIGTAIWKLLSVDPTVMTIRARLLDTYDVTPEMLDQDLQTFITHLLDAGLVIPEP